jgi:hypothetical protein
MFDEQIRRVQHRYLQLYQRVQKGDEAARLARDEADRRQKELRVRQREKVAELDRLQVVREGLVRYLGTARIVPIAQTSLAAQLAQQSNISPDELVRNDLIEVKARAGEGAFVELTPNEWLQARRHSDTYWLYIVWNCGNKPYVITIENPAQTLASVIQEQVVIEGYRVPGEAIARLRTNTSVEGN